MERYDVFISYRRDGAEYLAHNLYERLREKGYSVFQDIESLRSGNFNIALYDIIALCNDVILVLPPNGLDRCANEDDWVRKEIAFALSNGKNVIPIMMPGFEWPNTLPDDIIEIKQMNGLVSSTAYFNEFLEKLTGFLISDCHKEKRIEKHSLRAILIIAIYIIGAFYPLFHLLLPVLPFSLLPRILYFLWLLAGAFWIWNKIETSPRFAAMCFGTIKEEELNLEPNQLYSRIIGAFGKKALISVQKTDEFETYYKLKRLEFGSWDGKKTNYLKIEFKRNLEYYDPSVLYLHSLSRGGQGVKMLTHQGFVVQTTPDFVPKTVDYLTKNSIHIFLFYNKHKLHRAIVFNCKAEEIKEWYQRHGEEI